MIYSPLDALEICRTHPEQTIVLAAVGFETTAPSYALLVKRALQASIGNLRLLTALRRMPPALDLLCSPESGIDGFLAPGHVSAIIGSRAYESYALTYCKPFVVAGFKAEDVLGAIARLVQLCRREMPARGVVENAYPAIVRPDGNQKAQAVLTEVFEVRVCGLARSGCSAGIRLPPQGTLCGFRMPDRLRPLKMRSCPAAAVVS